MNKIEQIFAPEYLTEEHISIVKQALDNNDGIDLYLLNIQNLMDAELWESFINLSSKLHFLELRLGIRVERDTAGNKIKGWGNLDFIKDLPNIKKLSIGDSLESLENLKYIDSLSTLNIEQRSKAVDLSPITKFNKTIERLFLEGKFKNLDVISQMREVKYLNFTNIGNFDMNLITKLNSLETISFIGKINFINTDAIRQNSNLQNLDLTKNNTLVNLEWLEGCENIVHLVIDSCKNLNTLPDFTKMPNLKHLIFENSGLITNLETLVNSSSLEELVFYFPANPPNDFKVLSDLKIKKLKVFYRTEKLQKEVNEVLN